MIFSAPSRVIIVTCSVRSIFFRYASNCPHTFRSMFHRNINHCLYYAHSFAVLLVSQPESAPPSEAVPQNGRLRHLLVFTITCHNMYTFFDQFFFRLLFEMPLTAPQALVLYTFFADRRLPVLTPPDRKRQIKIKRERNFGTPSGSSRQVSSACFV